MLDNFELFQFHPSKMGIEKIDRKIKIDRSREIFGVGIQYFYNAPPPLFIHFPFPFQNPFRVQGTIHV